MQATIAVLGQRGWHPVAPDKWITADSSAYADLERSAFANAGILDALTSEFERAAWRPAGKHFLGAGLESGIPNLEPTRSATRWLLKRDLWKEVKALDCIVCGGVWAGFRIGESTPCDACGAAGRATSTFAST